MRDDRRDTLPPCALELERVAEFEAAARVDENDARLKRLAELIAWRDAERNRE